VQFSEQQKQLIGSSFDTAVYVSGPAGSGKTTAGVEYLKRAINSGIPADSILILTPQRSLAKPYRQYTLSADFPASGAVSILTLGGLAQRMVGLFWPMVAKLAGFKDPTLPPQFLTLETAQYYLAQIVSPLLEKGYFDSITIDPNRIYSQILDNMNKAASVGFGIDEIGTRLAKAWSGLPKQTIIYEQVQDCALQFRQFCYTHNLLDFSLQFEVFNKHLWPSTLCRSFLKGIYQHLIYDNIEEDVPVAHDIVKAWLPDLKSALLIHDEDAGFRTFLGADDLSAKSLHSACKNEVAFSTSFTQPDVVAALEQNLSFTISQHQFKQVEAGLIREAFSIQSFRFFTQALDWVADEVAKMIHQQHIDPAEIVILTPFLSDSLRFSLTQRIGKAAVPYFTFRPSRGLREEPPVSAMFTLAKIAHPQWGLRPTRHDLRYMLMQVIPEIDLIRADLVTQILYSPNRTEEGLISFAQVRPEMQQRITYVVGEKYEALRGWVEQYRQTGEVDLDIFFAQLFGELLSQHGFLFHENYASAALISRLVDSSRKFRQVTQSGSSSSTASVAKEYVKVVEEGLIAAQYLSNWEDQTESNAVLIAPAFTFLMSNRPVTHQFWLDIGSSGWWSRLDQPLTQPYVLSRNWQGNRQWTSADEQLTNQVTLERVATGLLRRCSGHVNMISIGMNESGSEERGALLVAIQSLLRGLTKDDVGTHV
jgi:hypothetical protein